MYDKLISVTVLIYWRYVDSAFTFPKQTLLRHWKKQIKMVIAGHQVSSEELTKLINYVSGWSKDVKSHHKDVCRMIHTVLPCLIIHNCFLLLGCISSAKNGAGGSANSAKNGTPSPSSWFPFTVTLVASMQKTDD